VQAPFVHNGFLAQVHFVNLSANRKKEVFHDHQQKGQEKQLMINPNQKDNQHSVIQHDEAVLTYARPARVIEQVPRPNHLSHPENKPTESKTFACRDEASEPHRAGLITSSQLLHSNHTCSIVFRGEERDLVLLRINSLQLR
jgi:hypothetical protein